MSEVTLCGHAPCLSPSHAKSAQVNGRIHPPVFPLVLLEIIVFQLMTSDRKRKASREGSKRRKYKI